MTTFGFSSYLKVVSLRPKPQRTELKKRIFPSDEAYDYHRSLRRLISRILIDGASEHSLLDSISRIKNQPERQSALSGIQTFLSWRAKNVGELRLVSSKTYTSPEAVFKVSFTPDFAIEDNGRVTAVHVWNTLNPELDIRMMHGALSLFPDLYLGDERPPDDLAVLSLRNSTLYRLSEAGDHLAIGLNTVRHIEGLFQEILAESRRGGYPSGERPSSPPPAP